MLQRRAGAFCDPREQENTPTLSSDANSWPEPASVSHENALGAARRRRSCYMRATPEGADKGESKMEFLHTMVRVADLGESLEFYTEKLGLVEVKRAASPSSISPLRAMSPRPRRRTLPCLN
jgi:hypothetical protein